MTWWLVLFSGPTILIVKLDGYSCGIERVELTSGHFQGSEEIKGLLPEIVFSLSLKPICYRISLGLFIHMGVEEIVRLKYLQKICSFEF